MGSKEMRGSSCAIRCIQKQLNGKNISQLSGWHMLHISQSSTHRLNVNHTNSLRYAMKTNYSCLWVVICYVRELCCRHVLSALTLSQHEVLVFRTDNSVTSWEHIMSGENIRHLYLTPLVCWTTTSSRLCGPLIIKTVTTSFVICT